MENLMDVLFLCEANSSMLLYMQNMMCGKTVIQFPPFTPPTHIPEGQSLQEKSHNIETIPFCVFIKPSGKQLTTI
jgi:hypothetical protein